MYTMTLPFPHDNYKKNRHRKMGVMSAIQVVGIHKGYTDAIAIGRGKYGDVYKTRDPKLDMDVAVKVVVVESLPEAEREYKVWCKLRHPNIVPLLESYHLKLGFSEYCCGIFVMPLMRKNIAEMMDCRRFLKRRDCLQKVRGWLYEILTAVQYLNSLDLCHLDIKQENVLISSEARAMLCDFSFANVSTKSFRSNHLGVPFQDRPPEVCPTLRKCCQECPHAAEVDGKAFDMWCFGKLTLRVLSVSPPPPLEGQRLCWVDEVYPSLNKALQKKEFVKEMKKKFSATKTQEIRPRLAFDFIHCFLRVDPKNRTTPTRAMEHRFLDKDEVPGSRYLGTDYALAHTYDCCWTGAKKAGMSRNLALEFHQPVVAIESEERDDYLNCNHFMRQPKECVRASSNVQSVDDSNSKNEAANIKYPSDFNTEVATFTELPAADESIQKRNELKLGDLDPDELMVSHINISHPVYLYNHSNRVDCPSKNAIDITEVRKKMVESILKRKLLVRSDEKFSTRDESIAENAVKFPTRYKAVLKKCEPMCSDSDNLDTKDNSMSTTENELEKIIDAMQKTDGLPVKAKLIVQSIEKLSTRDEPISENAGILSTSYMAVLKKCDPMCSDPDDLDTGNNAMSKTESVLKDIVDAILIKDKLPFKVDLIVKRDELSARDESTTETVGKLSTSYEAVLKKCELGQYEPAPGVDILTKTGFPIPAKAEVDADTDGNLATGDKSTINRYQMQSSAVSCENIEDNSIRGEESFIKDNGLYPSTTDAATNTEDKFFEWNTYTQSYQIKPTSDDNTSAENKLLTMLKASREVNNIVQAADNFRAFPQHRLITLKQATTEAGDQLSSTTDGKANTEDKLATGNENIIETDKLTPTTEGKQIHENKLIIQDKATIEADDQLPPTTDTKTNTADNLITKDKHITGPDSQLQSSADYATNTEDNFITGDETTTQTDAQLPPNTNDKEITKHKLSTGYKSTTEADDQLPSTTDCKTYSDEKFITENEAFAETDELPSAAEDKSFDFILITEDMYLPKTDQVATTEVDDQLPTSTTITDKLIIGNKDIAKADQLTLATDAKANTDVAENQLQFTTNDIVTGYVVLAETDEQSSSPDTKVKNDGILIADDSDIVTTFSEPSSWCTIS